MLMDSPQKNPLSHLSPAPLIPSRQLAENKDANFPNVQLSE